MILQPLSLMRAHVSTIFTLNDDRLPRFKPDGTDAPRFFIGQTLEGNRWWFREDLDPALVHELEAVCQEEPRIRTIAHVPLCHASYKAILAAQAPISNVWAGPAYRCPDSLTAPEAPIFLTEDHKAMLEPYCTRWQDMINTAQPFAAIVQEGCVVTVCASVCRSREAHEAGVETHPQFRHRGYAAQVVAAWATAVREQGSIPLYSTAWENKGSQAVAHTLGLIPYGATFHIT